MFPTVCILMVPDGGKKRDAQIIFCFDPVIYFTKECRLGLDKKHSSKSREHVNILGFYIE